KTWGNDRMRCKFKILVAVLLVGFTLSLAGWALAGGPQLTVPEPSHDFGEVAEGEVVSHEFTLRNTGTEALQIADVRPG
ncbi:MAG: DUF1573 domain-containing protein, partial [Desulfobacterota bacterium]|nr:DUF1573 domain-containing protein [Thermodesulfobacteriota bacterium]